MQTTIHGGVIHEVNSLISDLNRYNNSHQFGECFNTAQKIIDGYGYIIGHRRASEVAVIIYSIIMENFERKLYTGITTEQLRLCLRMSTYIITRCSTFLNEASINNIERIILSVGLNHSNFARGPGRDHDAALSALETLYNKRKTMDSWRALSLLYSSLGRYDDAWRRGCYAEVVNGTNYWNGEACDTLMMLHRWGVGDLILSLRYLPLAATRARTVYLSVPERLVPLMRGFKDLGNIIIESSFAASPVEAIPVDAVVDEVTLPMALGIGTTHVRPVPSYLAFDDREVADWKRVVRRSRGLHIGLIWSSGSGKDDRRTIGFDVASRLFDHQDITFIGLQANKYEIFTSNLPGNFIDFGLFDIKNTALIMSGLDMVITPCNGMAQLSSALGVETLVLLRQDCAWLWHGAEHHCQWHQSARLFRQRQEGCWDDVINAVSTYIINRHRDGPPDRL